MNSIQVTVQFYLEIIQESHKTKRKSFIQRTRNFSRYPNNLVDFSLSSTVTKPEEYFNDWRTNFVLQVRNMRPIVQIRDLFLNTILLKRLHANFRNTNDVLYYQDTQYKKERNG
ncbi:hypothetical protein BDC45DRAFT_470836, partial [Circinella umbellata]